MQANHHIDLNDRFRHALHLMEQSSRSLFITGRAGTGKSTLLSHFCAQTKKKPVVLAPTGVAALNVRGQTIHKFFHFYIDVTPEKIRNLKVRPRNPKIYKKLETIIIDEISMVRADLLDCIDEFLRLYGPETGKAFGGVQMIFVGDLYQLPPVVNRESEEVFATVYDTPYFFSARCLKEADFSVIELDTIYRQKEQDFVDLLNRIRTDEARDADIAYLNQRYNPSYKPSGEEFFIHLTTTNAKADEINAQHLLALTTKLHVTNAVIEGDFSKEYYPTALALQFKIGAQIMLINNDAAGRWVNGSIGVIEAISRDEADRAYAEVRLEDAKELVHVYPHKWEVYRYTVDGGQIEAQAVGTFTQFPFRLAWAVTIHKAQGKTFGHVMIDIDRGTFAPGQLYVALSRCTTFEGIVLKSRLARHHVMTDHRIVDFLAAHPYLPPAESFEVIDSAPINAAAKPAASRAFTNGNEVRKLMEKLAQGMDPIRNMALPEDSPYRHPELLAAFRYVLTMRDPKESSRKQPREGAVNHGKAWKTEEKKRLAESFKEGISLKQLALEHGRTVGSVRGELIKQGLVTMDELPEDAVYGDVA